MIRKKLEEILVEFYDCTSLSFKETKNNSTTAILELFKGAVPEQALGNGYWDYGFNQCRSEILKNIEGEA